MIQLENDLLQTISDFIVTNGGYKKLASDIENEWNPLPKLKHNYQWKSENVNVLIENHDTLSRKDFADVLNLKRQQVQDKIRYLRDTGAIPKFTKVK